MDNEVQMCLSTAALQKIIVLENSPRRFSQGVVTLDRG